MGKKVIRTAEASKAIEKEIRTMRKLTEQQIKLREKCVKESEAYFKKEWAKPGFAEDMDTFRQEYQMNVAMYKAKKESGLTQTEIAKRMGIPRPNVSRIEHSRTVSFDTFCSYLKACGFAFTFALMPSS